jgi:hypothetical protein
MPGRLVFATTANGGHNATERMVIDSSGRLLVGTSSTIGAPRLDVVGNSSSDTGEGIVQIRRGESVTNNNVTIGALNFGDTTSGGFRRAQIVAASDGAGGSGDLPTRLVFTTTADSESVPAERMRIDSSGRVMIPTNTGGFGSVVGHTFFPNGKAMHVTTDDTIPVLINRQHSDGTLIQFRQADATEGSINVSGTTVSLSGAHLSRWSQLPGGVERIEILRGSVLSNLDEMCEWAYEAKDAVLYTEDDELPEGVSVGDVKIPARNTGTEDNEQLNRMKVSDVEGDRNVAGVFQAWDDEDDTYVNDFYCAMTGDFVIRIAQGTTVARGDLLMSAGDGTAKPQDDDIVRSKTIAKVTSTTVSTTYSDGSYCVPCVLMAC